MRNISCYMIHVTRVNRKYFKDADLFLKFNYESETTSYEVENVKRTDMVKEWVKEEFLLRRQRI